MLVRIAERVSPGAFTGQVDEAAGVVRGAVICSFESANRRKYPRPRLERDFRKYEGAKIHFDHESGGRKFRDWVGLVQNVKPASDGRPRGDLRFFKTDANVPKLLEAARICPGKFGLSHVANCKVQRDRDGWEIIEGIEEVESVDIVLDPATNTGGLFEGKGGRRMGRYKLREYVGRLSARVRPARRAKLWEAVDVSDVGDDVMPDDAMVDPDAGDADRAAESAMVAVGTAVWKSVVAGDLDPEVGIGRLRKIARLARELMAVTDDTAEPVAAESRRRREGRAAVGGWDDGTAAGRFHWQD